MLANDYRVIVVCLLSLSTWILILPLHLRSLPNHTKESTVFTLDPCLPLTYVGNVRARQRCKRSWLTYGVDRETKKKKGERDLVITSDFNSERVKELKTQKDVSSITPYRSCHSSPSPPLSDPLPYGSRRGNWVN